MNDKSARLTEKLFIILTILIFLLIYFLSGASTQFVLEKKIEASLLAASSGEHLEKENSAAPIALNTAGVQEETPLLSYLAPQPYLYGESQPRLLRVRVQLINRGEKPSSQICLELPLMAELDSPYQRLLRESFTPKPAAINTLPQGNRTAIFNLPELSPGESKLFVAEYYLNVIPLRANLNAIASIADSMNLSSSGGQFVDALYLRPSEKIESEHPEIVDIAQRITAGLKSDLEKATAIFKFVINHIEYDLNSPHRNRGALSALRSRSGVCEDYASLFVALSRSAGIPARVVNGYADPQGTGEIWNIPKGKVFPLKGYRHSWAEFYLAGIGWVPADLTLNIYDPGLSYFASLPRASHLAQNYQDQNIRLRYHGGDLAVIWEEELEG